MSTTHFKFVELDGVTRRVSFAEKPTWTTLATRIQSLFGIPIENVSVAYIDADNDQVTLSSQEELTDYYVTSHQAGHIIKFIVQDLSALRSRNDPSRSSQPKNSFVGDGVDFDDEWLGLGGVFVPRPGSDGPHAFVEVIDSDAGNSTIRGVNPAEPLTTMSSPTPSFTAPLDKGKGRADPEEDSFSTTSLLMADAPPKPPVHVYEHSFSKDMDAQSLPGSFKEGSLLDESTPAMQAKDIDQDRADPPSTTEDPTDPPLAPVDPSDAPTTPTSLVNDIAAVIQAFNNVLSSHPEISEGLRNIARNAANGTYWAAHRENISQVAQRITQEAQNASEQIRRTAEQDAAQRVSEALNGFFRTFSQQVGDLPSETPDIQPPPPTAPAPEVPPGPTDSANAPPVFGYHPFGHTHARMRGPDTRPPWMRWTSFPHHSPLDIGGPGGWPRQFPPPPGPPPPPHHPHPPPPPPPPPHFSPTPGPSIPGAWNDSAAGYPAPPPAAEPMTTHQEAAEHELKSKVQEAKARYKAEKQKYRSELDTLRQQRRHHFERPHAGPSAPVENTESVHPVPPTRPPVERVIAVQGRKGNPTMEVVSVQRHHTFPGHRHHRRFEAGPSDITSRHVNRISRRLSDMGFTLTAYPDLQTRIRALMPTGGNFSPEEEDNIVTTLLEELLVLSPKPTASN